MGYLFDHYCHETQADALACALGHPEPLVINGDTYYPSFESGVWILKTAGIPAKTLPTPILSFPYCETVGPAHLGEQMSLASDFWIPLFWAIGISAAFMLFKKA